MKTWCLTRRRPTEPVQFHLVTPDYARQLKLVCNGETNTKGVLFLPEEICQSCWTNATSEEQEFLTRHGVFRRPKQNK